MCRRNGALAEQARGTRGATALHDRIRTAVRSRRKLSASVTVEDTGLPEMLQVNSALHSDAQGNKAAPLKSAESNRDHPRVAAQSRRKKPLSVNHARAAPLAAMRVKSATCDSQGHRRAREAKRIETSPLKSAESSRRCELAKQRVHRPMRATSTWLTQRASSRRMSWHGPQRVRRSTVATLTPE